MKLPVEKEPPCAVVALGVVATDASEPPATPCGIRLLLFAIVSEYDDHGRERCGTLRLVEVEPTPDETDFTSLPINEIVKNASVCPGWQQGHHGRLGLLRLLAALLHPFADFAAIGRVTEYSVAGPVLRQTVVLLRVMPLTFCVFVSGAGVQVKMEFCVQSRVKAMSGRLEAMILAISSSFIV